MRSVLVIIMIVQNWKDLYAANDYWGMNDVRSVMSSSSLVIKRRMSIFVMSSLFRAKIAFWTLYERKKNECSVIIFCLVTQDLFTE